MFHPRLDEKKISPCEAFDLYLYSLTASNHNEANKGEGRDMASTTNLFEEIGKSIYDFALTYA